MLHTATPHMGLPTGLARSRRGILAEVLPLVLVLLLGIAIYWPLLQYTFFVEDPVDIGQVNGRSYTDLLLLPNSNLYYRPLMLMTMKLLQGAESHYSPLPYHALDLAMHLLSALLLYGVACEWFGRRKPAFGAALLFLIYPVSFEATARAMSPHPLLMVFTLGALWAYTAGRVRARPWLIGLAFGLSAAGMLVQENGILTPFMLIVLEYFLYWQHRVRRFNFRVLIFLAPVVAFIFLWFGIPRASDTSLQLGLHGQEALYLSQGLSFPFAALLSQTGGWGLTPNLQAAVALLLALITLMTLCPRAMRPQLALALVLWVLASCLAWVARDMDYLAVSPRLMYFPSFAAALAWATLIPPIWPARLRLQPVLGALVILALGAQSTYILVHEITLYRNGSALMDQVLAAGQQGSKLLFVNVPDRFAYRQPFYPLGYWGMLVAPVSMDIADYVWLATGQRVQTRSLSDLPLGAVGMDASPYRVNTRGGDVHASGQLYEGVLWADKVFLTSYHPDGSFTLVNAGAIRSDPSPAAALGRIGDVADVLSSTVELRDGYLIASVQWRAHGNAHPTDTLFIHVLDSNGQLVAQEDGDSLGGLVPPSAWRAGNEVLDRRIVTLKSPLAPGNYKIGAGMYDRATGARYQAFDVSGEPIPGNEMIVTELVVR